MKKEGICVKDRETGKKRVIENKSEREGETERQRDKKENR